MIRRLFERLIRREPPPAGAGLSPERRAEVVEDLHHEFDLLCLGAPAQWRIDAALREAEARP